MALRALVAPLALALGVHPGHLLAHLEHRQSHTHPRRSCQNPDVLINPGSTTLSDTTVRWMQEGMTPDLCQGWRIQPLRAPSAPLLPPTPHPQTSPASVASTAAPNNDGGEPIHPRLGTRGQGGLVTLHEHKTSTDTQVCKHTLLHTHNWACVHHRKPLKRKVSDQIKPQSEYMWIHSRTLG